MSKYGAYRLPVPFFNTSHHHALLRSEIAMWFGTMSRTWPIPFSSRARHNSAWPSAPPSSPLTRE